MISSNELTQLSQENNNNNLQIYDIDCDNEESKVVLKILFIVIFFVFIFFIKINKKETKIELTNKIIFENIESNKDQEIIVKNEDNPNEISKCDDLDPINIFKIRIKNGPNKICENNNSEHICYKNHEGYYNEIFFHINGVLCLMKNIILDPSKCQMTEHVYKGPVDTIYLGRPILYKGFFNMRCKEPQDFYGYGEIYNDYFGSWDYEYENKDEKIEELAPGKTIFFLGRNQDSPNLFHGNSELINIISMMKLFNLKPEDIKIVSFESMEIRDDPFRELYLNLVSKGGEPIHVRKLKKKYHISSAIFVPINLDSPLFIKNDFPKCENSTETYKILNNLVDQYLDLKEFKDTFKSDNKVFYYPKSVIENHKKHINFTKFVTIQWRKVWPKGRKNQQRLLGNGKELADILASIVPNNVLIRLVNTASLPMKEQISLIRKTDYLVGIHGAGLSLSIYMKKSAILHEILPAENLKVLVLMSALSGHRTYSDIIKAEIRYDEGLEKVYFDIIDFSNNVKKHMEENDFFK